MLTASLLQELGAAGADRGLTCPFWERGVSPLGLEMSWAQVRPSIQAAATGEGEAVGRGKG